MHSGGAGDEAPRVMVLAATNFPWDIDEALRRQAWYLCCPDLPPLLGLFLSRHKWPVDYCELDALMLQAAGEAHLHSAAQRARPLGDTQAAPEGAQ